MIEEILGGGVFVAMSILVVYKQFPPPLPQRQEAIWLRKFWAS